MRIFDTAQHLYTGTDAAVHIIYYIINLIISTKRFPAAYPKPQVLGTTRTSDPRLFVIPSDDYTYAGRSNPCDNHKRTV